MFRSPQRAALAFRGDYCVITLSHHDVIYTRVEG